MTTPYTLKLADPLATLEIVGGKGASLARMRAAGLPVPDGLHVSTTAYRRFVDENELNPRILNTLAQVDLARPASLESASQVIRKHFAAGTIPADVAAAVVAAYEQLAGGSPTVAVRSSATAEDLPEASFAGQQETFLNVSGADAVLDAVKRCWASLWTARAIGYRARQGIAPDGVALAVVVQLLVPAEAAGILFTANPVTGDRSQVVISATWGLGEAVVGGLVTPDTVTVDKASGQVVVREIADKPVMTVRADGGTQEQPVSETLRRQPALNDEGVVDLVRLGMEIEQLYGTPMDVEWALADGKIAIVQARPITALPEHELAPPTEWKLPSGAYVAMRNNIVELMAEPLSPLFDTLGRAAINASLGRLLSDFFGRTDLMPQEVIISVNQYAYFNGSLSAGSMGRIVLGSVGIARRMFRGAVERWTEVGRPHYLATMERWQATPWQEFSATKLLQTARELSEAAIDAYGALVGGVIPAAWISEGLFTAVYKALIKRRDDPVAPVYLLGFDSGPILAERSLYDLGQWARTHDGLTSYLLATPAAQVLAQGESAPQGVEPAAWRAWRNRLDQHLQRYGHTIYNLDFATPVPADHPAPLVETCKLYIAGQGVDPYARQQAAAERREQTTQDTLSRLGGLRRRLFARFLAPAQKYAPLREDGLAEVGLSYPLLRQMLLELGRRFTASGMLDNPDDVFWLTRDEVTEAAARLDRGEELGRLADLVPQRQAINRAARRVSPPRMLPQIGRRKRAPKPEKRRRGEERLKGVAASPGVVTATARVLHGPEDFARMQPGNVLVAAITTPAWTPLFAMAGGVVTDIGGPLSHGSIVAREYGIPAVLGAGNATQRIRDGQTITVDGGAGVVLLSNGHEP